MLFGLNRKPGCIENPVFMQNFDKIVQETKVFSVGDVAYIMEN